MKKTTFALSDKETVLFSSNAAYRNFLFVAIGFDNARKIEIELKKDGHKKTHSVIARQLNDMEEYGILKMKSRTKSKNYEVDWLRFPVIISKLIAKWYVLEIGDMSFTELKKTYNEFERFFKTKLGRELITAFFLSEYSLYAGTFDAATLQFADDLYYVYRNMLKDIKLKNTPEFKMLDQLMSAFYVIIEDHFERLLNLKIAIWGEEDKEIVRRHLSKDEKTKKSEL